MRWPVCQIVLEKANNLRAARKGKGPGKDKFLAVQNQIALSPRKLLPLTRGQVMHSKLADADTEEAKRGMPDGGSHAANLAVLAFDEFKAEPVIRNGFAEADRRVARWNLWLRIERP